MLDFNCLWKKSDCNAVKADFFLPIFIRLIAVSSLVEKACFGASDALFGVSVPNAAKRLDLHENKKNPTLNDEVNFCFSVTIISFTDAISTFLKKCGCRQFRSFSLL